MGNTNDLYYLLQLILPEVFVYTRDIILHGFPWLANRRENDMDDLESKTRGDTPRHVSPDMIALSSMCALIFIIFILIGKCFKNDSINYDVIPSTSIPNNLQTVYTQCSATNVSSNITEPTPFACGDNLFSQEILQASIPFETTFLKTEQSDSSSFPSSPNSSGSSNFPLTKTQSNHSQHSQSTQTSSRIFKKTVQSQRWLIRRTRSGLVYGKYPL